MIVVVTILVLLTLSLFLMIGFVGFLTLTTDTKSVALGVAGVTMTVAGKFVYNLLDMLLNGHVIAKAVAANFLLLAITIAVGLLALTIIFYVDRRYKR